MHKLFLTLVLVFLVAPSMSFRLRQTQSEYEAKLQELSNILTHYEATAKDLYDMMVRQ